MVTHNCYSDEHQGKETRRKDFKQAVKGRTWKLIMDEVRKLNDLDPKKGTP